MISMLRELGHDVQSASETFPGASDETLLELAFEERRAIITLDKDFGELVFLRSMRHPCIIRFVEMSVDEQVEAMRDLISNHSGSMNSGAFIVVTPTRIRVRND